MFQESFKGVSKKLSKFRDCFTEVQSISKFFQKSFDVVVVVVAAFRAEGGLVEFVGV